MPVLEAMQCDVPVITPSDSAMQEIAKDAALYADANNHTDIADKMMLLYKDENLRKELIQKGRQLQRNITGIKQQHYSGKALKKPCLEQSVLIRLNLVLIRVTIFALL